jgi:hypothetical protein
MAIAARRKLGIAASLLLEQIETAARPIVTEFELSLLVERARKNSKAYKLRLRADRTFFQDLRTLKKNLTASRKLVMDSDYRQRSIFSVLTIPDLPAEDIVCLADPLAYVSHMSAMQRWGLTNRVSRALQISQPKLSLALGCLNDIQKAAGVDTETWPVKLKQVRHPHLVRKMSVSVYKSEHVGVARISPGSFTRVATVGQVFADMVQEPDLCGGMSHVLEVWDEHASLYLPLLLEGVDAYCSDLGKRRAGYILAERLQLNHPVMEEWKLKSILGAGGKLDPSKESGSQTSKAWNLSINV